MKKQILITIIVLWTTNAFAQFNFRAWQILSLDTAYSKKVLEKTEEYDINKLILSHGAVSFAMELYNEKYEPKTISEKGKQLKKIVGWAKQKNIDTYFWLHELADIPEEFLKGKKVDLDNPKLWKYIEARYTKIFTDFPEIKGIQITTHETHYKVFDTAEVVSKMPMPVRFHKLVNTIHLVCKKFEKDLILRTFLYTPEQYAWMNEGIQMLDDDVIIENKYVPNDWQPYFPNNSMMKENLDKRQIVEYDASAEYQGRNFIVWAAVDHFKERMNYAQTIPNVMGYNVRLNHAGYDCLFTPNSINLYTLSQVAKDKNITAGKIWLDWATIHYGKDAASSVVEILRPTFDFVNNMYFPQGVWFTNHSKLVHLEYGLRQVPRIADWDKNYQKTVDELMNPTENTLQKLVAEKDSMLIQIQQSQWKLWQARNIIKKEDYDDLSERLYFQMHMGLMSKSNIKLFCGVLLAKKMPQYKEFVKQELIILRNFGNSIPEFEKTRTNNYLLDPLVVEKVAKSFEEQLIK